MKPRLTNQILFFFSDEDRRETSKSPISFLILNASFSWRVDPGDGSEEKRANKKCVDSLVFSAG